MSGPSHAAGAADDPSELRELRLALRREHPSSADFRAFLLDYFPELARGIAPTADRTESENLFLERLDSDGVRKARELLGLGPERDRPYGGRGRSEDWRWERVERAAQRQLVRWHEAGGTEKPRLRRRHAEGLGTFRVAEYQQGGARVHFALLLAPHDLEEAFLRTAQAALRERGLAGDGAGLIRPAEVVYSGPPPSVALVSLASELGLRLRSLDDFECLLDLREHVAWQSERLEKHPAYPPSLYVPQRMQISEGASFDFQGSTEDAIAVVMSWLKDINRPRFVLLLGDFGVGKTFLLREAARRLGLSGKPPWPLFLELRQLEKAQDLRPLLASYLTQPKHSETLPVADVDALLAMLAVGKVVLFFDGFDELALRVSYDRATQHLDTLMQSVAAPGTLAKVVVSSRTQHFLSMADLAQGMRRARRTVLADRLSAVAVSIGRLLPFGEPQILEFLRHRLGSEDLAQARMRLITDVKDLLGLSHNPRMLSFIAELPEADLRAALQQSGTISAAKLYEILVHKWLQFEAVRADDRVPEPGLSFDQRLAAVTTIALHLWGQSERFVALDALGEAVRGLLRDHDCATQQLGSGTLLTRDDAGRFAFLHESVLEWLVARAAQHDLAAGRDALLGRHPLSPLMAEFLRGLAGDEAAAAWADRVLLAPDEDLGADAGTLKKNALTLLARLGRKAPERQNLAGQDLAGRDFTGQSLAGAILDDARLHDAQLAGVDLRRASLRGASLLRANLDRAVLRDADLRGADLSTASLLQADLRGARLDEHTRLRRARLLGAKLDPNALDALPPSALWGACRSLEARTLQAARGGAKAIAWHPTEPVCAVGAGEQIVLWDCVRGLPLRALRGHEGEVTCVSFSPDGQTLASGSRDHAVRLWQVGSGQALLVLHGHKRALSSVSFSPDGRTLASGAHDQTVRLWQVGSGQALLVLRGHESEGTSVSFSPDGQTLASGAHDQTVRLWQVGLGQALLVLRGHESEVTSVSFSPDGQTLASGAGDKTVRLWQAESGQARLVLRGHESPVSSVSFSPDGQTLASGSWDKTVRLWRAGSGQALLVLRGHESPVGSVSFSPDGQTLASGAWDKTVRLWQAGNGQELLVLCGHESALSSVSFSPHGRTLASGSWDHAVRLWQAGSGQELLVLYGHDSPVSSVSFSPDGQTVASGACDQTVRLWQVGSGRELLVLRGHENTVTSVSFSPDGQILASGACDQTARLWQAGSGQELLVLRGHESWVSSVSFSPDGHRLISGGADGSIRIWDVATGRCLAALYACGDGWLAQVSDGRYKLGGELPRPSPIFFSAGLCHFAPGDLDALLPGLRLAEDQDLFDLPPWDLSQHPESQTLLSAHSATPPDPEPPAMPAPAPEPATAAVDSPPPAKVLAPTGSPALAASPIASGRWLHPRSVQLAAPALGAGLAIGAFWLVEQRLTLPTASLAGLLGAMATTALRRKG